MQIGARTTRYRTGFDRSHDYIDYTKWNVTCAPLALDTKILTLIRFSLLQPRFGPSSLPRCLSLQPMTRATSDRYARKQCPVRPSYRPTRTCFLSLHEWGGVWSPTSIKSCVFARKRIRVAWGYKGEEAKSLEMWRDAYYTTRVLNVVCRKEQGKTGDGVLHSLLSSRLRKPFCCHRRYKAFRSDMLNPLWP